MRTLQDPRTANPNVLLSYYVLALEDNVRGNGDNPNRHDFAYWKANHPYWILHKCDRTKPVTWDQGDFALYLPNPDFIDNEVNTYMKPARPDYNAINADNFYLFNFWGAAFGPSG